MSVLHQQLLEGVREVENILRSREYASQLMLRLQEEEQAIEELEMKLEKDQRDVVVLEKDGITSFLRKVIGDREEKLEKEQEEYLDASRRHIELYKSIELIRFELTVLKQKEDLLEHLEKKVAILLKEREKELISSNVIFAGLVKNLDEEVIQYNAHIKSLQKIIATGQTALTLVTSIENYLNEALAQLISNKAGSALLVDDAVANARRPLQKANHLLIRFKKELILIYSEVNLDTKIQFEAYGSYTNLDRINFVSDLTFKEKINISRRSAKDIRQQLEIILNLLDQEHDEILGKLSVIEEERKRLILASE